MAVKRFLPSLRINGPKHFLQQSLRAGCMPLAKRRVIQISPQPPSVPGTLHGYVINLPAGTKAHLALDQGNFDNDLLIHKY
ncbi:hypothetical protein Y1Q_0003236 [Alligator mississippiensis]|uniref:Uncharacterized protein n=1 Tax=Alligator mississippiensis TaxID=8496 RepID=A0A151MDZ4_ALLMI|nr:hypothetical protein Y1Q_0003236 [Alligator mississippiensis]